MNHLSSSRKPVITTEQRPLKTKYDLEKALDGVVSEHSKRHWRTLCQELGERAIPIEALGNTAAYSKEIIDLLDPDDDYITLSELAIIAQYKKAISEGDTKAATFLRDTAGYKPSVDVTVERKDDGLSSMSDEELHKMLSLLEQGIGVLNEENC